MIFCLFLTELKNCRRQRHKARWLAGNWDWITEAWSAVTGEQTPKKAFSQSSISRLLQGVDLWSLKEQFFKALRENDKANENSVHFPQKQSLNLKNIFKHYSFDGKSRKGIISAQTGRTEIDLIFFDVKKRNVIAMDALADKEGEAPRAHALLKRMGRSLERGVFTGDAGFASPSLISGIISSGHEYIIAVKGNAGEVYNVCKNLNWDKVVDIEETSDKKHGRDEVRILKRMYVLQNLKPSFEKYQNCKYIYRVESRRIVKGILSIEFRYFVASKGLNDISLKEIMKFIRDHWKQENGLHWVKDAILGEDGLRRMGNRGSRMLGFLKNIVVSIGYNIYKSVQTFVDMFDANPKKFTRALLELD
jgi:predicted transposase YbfD/YdcC